MFGSYRKDGNDSEIAVNARSAAKGLVAAERPAAEPSKSPRSRAARLRHLLADWLLPAGRPDSNLSTEEMSWTCPTCRAPQQTVIAAAGDSGRIVTVSCACSALEYRVSVFVRPPRKGVAHVAVGVVWL